MNDIKLILLDMDGTLCDKDGRVPEEFFSLVPKMREMGIAIGIASGRNMGTIRPLFKELFNEMVCVTTNGTANYIDGKLISIDYMDQKDVRTIIDVAKQLGNCNPQIFFPEIIVMEKGNPLFELFNQMGFISKAVDDIYEYVDDVVLVSTIAYDFKEDVTLHFENVEGGFKYTKSGTGVVDYMPSHTSKAYGAKKLAESLGISMNQIMAIGDAGNDLELLENVGHPVAMANAMDSVKAIAKYITPKPNTENGCIEFIKDFFEVK